MDAMTLDELKKLAQTGIKKYSSSKKLDRLLSFIGAINKNIDSGDCEIEITTRSIDGCREDKLKFSHDEAVLISSTVRGIVFNMAEEIGEELKG